MTDLDPSRAMKHLRQILKWPNFFSLNPFLVLALSLKMW